MASRHRNYRLYCLVPNLDAARAVDKALSQANLKPYNLRVVVRREALVVGVAEASIRERTGILEAAKRGLVMGSIGGVITGLVAAIELPVNHVLAFGLIVFGTIIGSAFGAWASAMMGIEEPHSTIRPYQSAIESGQVLILVDAHDQQLEQIQCLIRHHHPDAHFSVT